jgi:hypothetical protein
MSTTIERLEERPGGSIAVAADMIYFSILEAWAGGDDQIKQLDREIVQKLAKDFTERFRRVATMLPAEAFAEFAIVSHARHRDMRNERGVDVGEVMDIRRQAGLNGAPAGFLVRFDELAAELAAEAADPSSIEETE